MAETLTITCDGCRTRVPKASRTKMRGAREAPNPGQTDLCPECAERAIEAVRVAAIARTGGAIVPRVG